MLFFFSIKKNLILLNNTIRSDKELYFQGLLCLILQVELAINKYYQNITMFEIIN